MEFVKVSNRLTVNKKVDKGEIERDELQCQCSIRVEDEERMTSGVVRARIGRVCRSLKGQKRLKKRMKR
jgi:hypothetical protein